ncbi:hypothetical protein [Arthrobacter psychrolactophilus]
MNESSDASDQGAQKKPQTSKAADLEQTPEPEIAASELAEPTLDAAEISEDVAESVDLEAVEAEAARVEHEAELASQGVSVSLGEGTAKDKKTNPDDNGEPVAEDAAEESGTELTEGEDSAANAPAEEPSDSKESPTEENSAEDSSKEDTVDTSTAETVEGGAVVATSDTVDTVDAREAPESKEVSPVATDEVPAEAPVASPPAGTGSTSHSTSEDEHGWRRPETPWQPKAGQWQSPAQLARTEEEAAGTNAIPVGGFAKNAAIPSAATSAIPAQVTAAAAGPATPHESPAAQSGEAMSASSKKKLFILLGAAVVGLGLIVFLIWLIVDLIIGGGDSENAAPAPTVSSQAETLAPSNAGTSPAATAEASKTTAEHPNDGLILAALSPLDWRSGDCLRNFTEPVQVRRCGAVQLAP